MCGRKLKKKGRKKSNAFSLVHVSTHKKKRKDATRGIFVIAPSIRLTNGA